MLTLIVAPIVALALAAFIKYSPWGLAMRAMSENADSARLSGVWVRRTSTLAWTLAGALSAFAAVLNAPGQTSVLTQVLSPDLLVLALIAGLVGAMVNLTAAFVAGIGLGIVVEALNWKITNPATVELILFGHPPRGAAAASRRTAEVAAASGSARRWLQGSADFRRRADAFRERVGASGVVFVVVLVVLLPFFISTGRSFLLSQICIYGVIALSLTVLTGWAGQVSLGQFGLVAVGSIMAAHLGNSVPLLLLLPFAGAVTAVVAVLVGLPALRVRGLYLAVSTLGFALFMQESVLATPCWTRAGAQQDGSAPACPTPSRRSSPGPASSGSASPPSRPSPGSRSGC